MSHRSIIKFLIVVVIIVTVVWSVANVHDYAAHFHNGPMVWTLGLSVGMANALSVYSFVIARTRNVKVAAVAGIILFGVMSGMLQTFLYLVNGAPPPAAIAFGWFGPVAEGILAWLHAALSEEQEPATRKQVAASSKQAASKQVQPPAPVKQTAISLQQVASKTDAEIAAIVKVTRQSVNGWRNNGKLESKILERLPELATTTTNGKEHI